LFHHGKEIGLGKGYGAMEGMSSEKINKPLNVITANEIGEIGKWV
jgi:hypothetical protein